jgi:hypothetical protein
LRSPGLREREGSVMRSKETIKDRQQSNTVRELKSEIEVQGDKERKRESERYHYVRFIDRENSYFRGL